MSESILNTKLDNNTTGHHVENHLSLHEKKSCENSMPDIAELSSQLINLSTFLWQYGSFYPEQPIAELQDHQFELIAKLNEAIISIHDKKKL